MCSRYVLYVSDYDKQQWQQQQQTERDAAWDKQREREAKARERSSSNAKRKIARLKATLEEMGKLTEWEGEFAESVTERLDEFGSAFADLEKGRPGDALSFAQKRVVASLNKKVKDARKAAKAERLGEGTSEENEPKPDYKPRSSFKAKKPKFTPRVRNIEDDFETDVEAPAVQTPPARQPFIPRSVSDVPNVAAAAKPTSLKPAPVKAALPAVDQDRPPVGRPFLRIVKSG